MRDAKPLQQLDIVKVKKADIERQLKEYKELAAAERWQIAKSVLIFTAVFGTMLIAPNMGRVISYFMKNTNNRRERFRVKKSLEKLKEKGFLNFIQKKKNEWGIALTKKGTEEAHRLKMPYLKLPRLKKWDHKWRLIISDIPEKHKTARDALAQWLIGAGCVRLQKSAWVYPYHCWDEVRAIVSMHNVNGFVRFANVEEFNEETEGELRKFFNLS